MGASQSRSTVRYGIAHGARLYLHVGMPKTGTTFLQGVLHGNAPALAKQGYLYPVRWRKGDRGGHYALNDIGRNHTRAPALIDDVRGYLARNPDRKVILSTEGLTHALLHEPGRQALAALLERCSEVAPPTVIMALRRLDQYFASAYLQVTKTQRGGVPLTPEEFIQRRSRSWDALFPALRWLREEAAPAVSLVPYREGTDMLPEMLRAMGFAEANALNTLNTGRALHANQRLGLKAHTLLALSDRALAPLGLRRTPLIALFESGAFEFEDEIYDYDLLGPDLRSRIHGRALEQARRHGIDEYVNAFAGAKLPVAPATRLDISAISAADLSELAEAIAARGVPTNIGLATPRPSPPRL